MNHKPTCHFSGALSDLASSVQKSHENDPTTNFYFLTISLPLQRLDPLCLWLFSMGAGSWVTGGLGGAPSLSWALVLNLHPSPPELEHSNARRSRRIWATTATSKAYLGRAPHVCSSQNLKTGLRGLQELSSDARSTSLIFYTRHHGYSPVMGKQT